MPDMDPIAPWLRRTVTDFDKQNAPKVEEVKPEVIDPAAPKVEAPVPPAVKVEEPVVPVPPKVEEPIVDAAPVSPTVAPAVASPAPVVTPAPVTTPVAAQPPTSPLK